MARAERWERSTEWPLTAAAVLFLAAYAIPIAVPTAPTALRTTCSVVVWATWSLFVTDYVVRLALAERRWHFVWHHALDLAVVVLPVLRPLRLVRLLALLSILNRTGARELRGKVITYAVGGTALLVVTGALAMTETERGRPGATITDLGDGIWWAVSTMCTVGYGDVYPVTTAGRFIAAGLMVAGIALLGVVTATLASWLVERVSEANEAEEAATRAQVADLAGEVRALRDALAAAAGSAAGGPGRASAPPTGPDAR
ncbi:potassium channel family protein [Luteimicrobium sp. DT211]|uniref:potassium channel family protein n=1 Tax=Luteimicrobium sp. DT211 TaxID=3393412 RepID=UPI003CF79E74